VLPARVLLGIFDTVYLLALTSWVGSVLFFSFGVAPIIFKVLGAEAGGRFVRALFPRYYSWGAISGAIALPAYVAVPLCFPEYRGGAVGIQALVILSGILVMIYSGNSLTPAINAARDAGAEARQRFDRLHRRSVWLNAVVLIAGIALLVAFANRPAPQSSGIVELAPRDRARFGAELSEVIEEIERKYGFRPPRKSEQVQAADRLSVVSPEMIEELESYYRRKRERELQRARFGQRMPNAGDTTEGSRRGQ